MRLQNGIFKLAVYISVSADFSAHILFGAGSMEKPGAFLWKYCFLCNGKLAGCDPTVAVPEHELRIDPCHGSGERLGHMAEDLDAFACGL